MIIRHVFFEGEAVEQRFLPHCSLAHHARILKFVMRIESRCQNYFKQDFFDGIGRERYDCSGWKAEFPVLVRRREQQT